MRKNGITRFTLSAMFLALALVLPLLTGQLPQMGSAFLPMHLPVLLCGFLCGWPWGLVVGLIAPVLRSLLFGMPPLVPTALTMTFELAAYGAFSGLLYQRLRGRRYGTYGALIGAMLAGRVVWGLASYAAYALFLPKTFTLEMFLAGAFVNAWPGILVQLVLVPLLVTALERAGRSVPAAES